MSAQQGMIDAHHHLWDLDRRAQAWLDVPQLAPIRRSFTASQFSALAEQAGVSRSVLVQVLPDAEETREFLALAAGQPLVAGVVGWTDLTAPDVAERLAALRESPGGDRLVGIRHLVQGEADARWLCRADVRRGLRAVAEAGLCYDLLTLPHQLPAAIETVRALPGLEFVLDHLSKPPIASGELEPWAALLRELAAEPNVCCKLSGMVTEADQESWTPADLRPYAETALSVFGAQRLMFGSDWPVCLVAGSYEQVVAAARDVTGGLSPHERAAVFHDTAARVYGLD
jgi:L-fuconolactonase